MCRFNSFSNIPPAAAAQEAYTGSNGCGHDFGHHSRETLLLPTIDEDGVYDDDGVLGSSVTSQASFWSQLSPRGPAGACSLPLPVSGCGSSAPPQCGSSQLLHEEQMQLLLGDDAAESDAEELLLAAIDLRLQQLTRLRGMRNAVLKARATDALNGHPTAAPGPQYPAGGAVCYTRLGLNPPQTPQLVAAPLMHTQQQQQLQLQSQVPAFVGTNSCSSASLEELCLSYAEQLLCNALGGVTPLGTPLPLPQLPQQQQQQQQASFASTTTNGVGSASCAAAAAHNMWGTPAAASVADASKLQQPQMQWALQQELLALLQQGN